MTCGLFNREAGCLTEAAGKAIHARSPKSSLTKHYGYISAVRQVSFSIGVAMSSANAQQREGSHHHSHSRSRPKGLSIKTRCKWDKEDYTGVTPCAAKLICESRVAILGDAKTTNSFKKQVEQHGFDVVPACLDKTTVELLSEQFDGTRHPERNLLSVPSVRALATSPYVKSWRPYLGQSASRSEGFSLIRLEAQIGKWFGTKM